MHRTIPRRPALPTLTLLMMLLIGLTASCARAVHTMTSPGTGTAMINGTIVAAGGTTATSSGATVRVDGGRANTTVDQNQSFVLTDVPAGTNIILDIVGAGLNASIPIGVLNGGDQVVLVLTRTNTTLEVDHTGRRNADGSQVTGRIDSIVPSDHSFVVTPQTIVTDGATQFFRSTGGAGSFNDLAIGLRVDITGTPGSPTTVVAKVVRLLDPGVDTVVNLTGSISSLTGTATDFQFNLQGRVVRGDTTTVFRPGTTFDNLANGVQVTVTGITAAPFVRATSIDVR